MPSHTNMATASARPEQPLGTVRRQTSPGPGPAGDPGPQPKTRPDASTRGHQSAAFENRPTWSPTRTIARQSDRRRAPHTRRPTALPHRHIPLPRLTPPAPGPSDPSAPYAPTPTFPPGAPVPKLQRHQARRPRGTIRRPWHSPSRHHNNATTHQPDRQYGQLKHHLAVTRPRARTRTRTRHTPPFRPTPRGQTRQAASSRLGPHIPKAGHRQPGPPRRSKKAREHWQATCEASPGGHRCQMAKPERRRNWQTTQSRRPHHAPSHNLRSPRCAPRRNGGDPRSGKKRHCQRRTYPPGDRPERRYVAG